MPDLAYNINGESFELPATASGWRVRRMKPRGAPEVVYGRDGVPLVIPIESDLEELRRNVDSPGRFRLDAVDERGRSIDDIPASYVQVASLIDPPAPPVTQAMQAVAHQGTDSIVAEAMRLNTELAKSIIDRFPEMMSAAAELLRAADGAGLPARLPRLLREATDRDDDDEDDDDDDIDPIDAPAAFDLNALVAQVVPVLVTGLMSGKVKLPGLAALFDWRKAQPPDTATQEAPTNPNVKRKKKRHVDPVPADTSTGEAEEPADGATTDAEVTADLPPLDPATMAHFLAIQSALSPDEAVLAREVAAQLDPTELRAWFDELSKLDVAEATAKIREVVSGAKPGGES